MMADNIGTTVQIQGWIDRLRAGDESAREELLKCACNRMMHLTRNMLRGYARVKRWEQTDDVFQNAAMRLYRALGEVQPETTRDFFRLAALNIRRELLDLAKHYYGPQGEGAHHASFGGGNQGTSSGDAARFDPSDSQEGPERLAAWTEFHCQVEALPDEEREIFDLLWYQGLSQAEAAEVLHVSERTIKRRWQSARLILHDRLHGELPQM